MTRIIKYVLHTRIHDLRMFPYGKKDDKWCVLVYTHSNYDGNPTTRHSMTGYTTFMHGVTIFWRSKYQSIITMSHSEAVWITLLEAAKEFFVINI